MRTTTAYFAGIGTVIAAVAAGLGGGLLLGDIMSPQQPKHPSSEVTRLEQRSSQAPISAMNGASQPVPYLGTSQVAATIAEPQAQSPAEATTQQQPQPQQAQSQQAQPPQPQQAAAQPAASQPQSADSKPAPAAAQAVAATEPPTAKERAAPEDSVAKDSSAKDSKDSSARDSSARDSRDSKDSSARDSSAKARDADLKRETRRAEDRRKAERRQQWAERRRVKPRDDDELRDVEDKVRQVTEERPLYSSRRSFDSEPGFFGSRINLFDQD